MKPHKHAELIKAWADGAEIEWFSLSSKEWLETKEPQWYSHREYRIKDPYRELKEAHAAGKVIEVQAYSGWTQVKQPLMWNLSPSEYRIKPEVVKTDSEPTNKLKLLCFMTDYGELQWHLNIPIQQGWRRVPSEDKEIEYEV